LADEKKWHREYTSPFLKKGEVFFYGPPNLTFRLTYYLSADAKASAFAGGFVARLKERFKAGKPLL
jgi:hypothetical protein